MKSVGGGTGDTFGDIGILWYDSVEVVLEPQLRVEVSGFKLFAGSLTSAPESVRGSCPGLSTFLVWAEVTGVLDVDVNLV